MKKDAATLAAAIELFALAVDTLRAVPGFPAVRLQRLDAFVAEARGDLQDLTRMRAELATSPRASPAAAALKERIKGRNAELPGLRSALNRNITYTELELVGPPAGHGNPGYIAFRAAVQRIYDLPK